MRDSETRKQLKPFGITQGKGFHITFENGWTVSVQFGPGNYGDNYEMHRRHDHAQACVEAGAEGSNRAEVWCFKGKDEHWPESPLGYQTSEQVAQIIACAVKGDFTPLSLAEGK